MVKTYTTISSGFISPFNIKSVYPQSKSSFTSPHNFSPKAVSNRRNQIRASLDDFKKAVKEQEKSLFITENLKTNSLFRDFMGSFSDKLPTDNQYINMSSVKGFKPSASNRRTILIATKIDVRHDPKELEYFQKIYDHHENSLREKSLRLIGHKTSILSLNKSKDPDKEAKIEGLRAEIKGLNSEVSKHRREINDSPLKKPQILYFAIDTDFDSSHNVARDISQHGLSQGLKMNNLNESHIRVFYNGLYKSKAENQGSVANSFTHHRHFTNHELGVEITRDSEKREEFIDEVHQLDFRHNPIANTPNSLGRTTLNVESTPTMHRMPVGHKLYHREAVVQRALNDSDIDLEHVHNYSSSLGDTYIIDCGKIDMNTFFSPSFRYNKYLKPLRNRHTEYIKSPSEKTDFHNFLGENGYETRSLNKVREQAVNNLKKQGYKTPNTFEKDRTEYIEKRGLFKDKVNVEPKMVELQVKDFTPISAPKKRGRPRKNPIQESFQNVCLVNFSKFPKKRLLF